MGLDMYLKKGKRIERKSIKDISKIEDEIYNGDNKELLKKYEDYVIEKKYDWLKEPRYLLTDVVAYWRKANQIHRWFVDNIQGGEDDCGYYEVTKEQLEELVKLCKEVLEKSKLVEGKINNGWRIVNGVREDILEDGYYIEDTSVAEKLLPTTSGFFFGSTDYDTYYIEDLKNTIEQIEKILEYTDFDKEYIVYTSSW